jgi:carbamoyltransferase
MYILGLSAYYHDSSACLIKDGEIIAAAEEERFTRKKHDSEFPAQSINYCLSEAKITLKEVDFIIFYDKPFLKFERILETYLSFAPRGFKSFSASILSWIKEKLFQRSLILKELSLLQEAAAIDLSKKLLFSEHHLSHAASAFYPSPFESAAVLTMDGVGEWATTSLAIGSGNNLSLVKEINFPHSLGLLYSAFTSYCGFKVNSGEYKLMGLAPYGEPIYADIIKSKIISIKQDGSYELDMSYFNYCTDLKMTSNKFHKLFDGPPRLPESSLTQKDMNLAASIQNVIEEILVLLAKNIAETTQQKNLCLAGGVALNCVANGKLLKENIFENIWVQPASGDSGGAIGAAFAAYHLMLGQPRLTQLSSEVDKMKGSFLGPSFDQENIEERIRKCGGNFKTYPQEKLLELTADALSKGMAVGWMNGRMEFGPRSLGGRSILADPRSPKMQKLLNLKVKFRESFRPFAPSILSEDAVDWFELTTPSPYMLFCANVVENRRIIHKEKLKGIEALNVQNSTIPAVTHIDYSARVQTVHKETNPTFHSLISQFKLLTNCPVLVNTSFNIRGEPIVCTPEDAFKCFMGTDLDVLVIGNSFLLKKDQNNMLANNYTNSFELD